jgi:hypothetical protein
MISGPADSVVRLRFMRPKPSMSSSAELQRSTVESTTKPNAKPRNPRRSSLDFALPSLDFSAPVLLSDAPASAKVNGDSAATSDDPFIYIDVSLVRKRVLTAGESSAKAAERASWAAGQRLCKNLSSPCQDSSSASDNEEGLPDAETADDAAVRQDHPYQPLPTCTDPACPRATQQRSKPSEAARGARGGPAGPGRGPTASRCAGATSSRGASRRRSSRSPSACGPGRTAWRWRGPPGPGSRAGRRAVAPPRGSSRGARETVASQRRWRAGHTACGGSRGAPGWACGSCGG